MLPQNQHMIFKAMKEIVIADGSSDLSALSRFVDYTVIVADQYYAGKSIFTCLIPYLLFFCSNLPEISTLHSP
jgi:hypothetical protein